VNQNDYGWWLFCTALVAAGLLVGFGLGAYLY
jgi:hypothetical protein